MYTTKNMRCSCPFEQQINETDFEFTSTTRNEFPCPFKHYMREFLFRAPFNNERWTPCSLRCSCPRELFCSRQEKLDFTAPSEDIACFQQWEMNVYAPYGFKYPLQQQKWVLESLQNYHAHFAIGNPIFHSSTVLDTVLLSRLEGWVMDGKLLFMRKRKRSSFNIFAFGIICGFQIDSSESRPHHSTTPTPLH